MRSRIVATMLLTGLVFAAVPGGAGSATSNRLYLMANDGNYRVWTNDPADARVGAAQTSWRCEVSASVQSTAPCRNVARSPVTYGIGFEPGTRLAADLAWTAVNAPTFRLEVDIDATGPFTVGMYIARSSDLVLSPAAAEVAPGVYEGSFGAAGSLQASQAKTLGVAVRLEYGNIRHITVGTAGRSYLEFPSTFQATTAAELAQDDTAPTAPSVFETADHRLEFDDADYEVVPFAGHTEALKTIPFTLARPAAAIYAFVDGLGEPSVYQASRASAPEQHTLLDRPLLNLTHMGVEFASAAVQVAAVDEPAGSGYALEIEPASFEPSQVHTTYPYTGALVIIYGATTLRSIEWSFPSSAVATFTTPFAGNSPPASEAIPAPSRATMVDVDLDVEAASPLPQRWWISIGAPGWGGLFGPTGTRFVVPGGVPWRAIAFPTGDQVYVESQSVSVTAKLTFTYASA